MTLWLRAVIGSHLKFETIPENLEASNLEEEVVEKLKLLGIPNPCCDVNEGEEDDCAIAIGARLNKIDTLYDYDHKHSEIPDLTSEQLAGIRAIADDLIETIKATGYVQKITVTNGLAVHATS
jgi:hypothetical protein